MKTLLIEGALAFALVSVISCCVRNGKARLVREDRPDSIVTVGLFGKSVSVEVAKPSR